MAYPKKPNNLKVLTGSRQPKTADTVELPVLDAIPQAPNWLPNPDAVNEFDKLANILHANTLLTEGGVGALAQMCALYGKMVQLWRAGKTPTGHMVAQSRALVTDFGLTPVAQGKVSMGGEKPKGNAFASNGKRKTG